MATGLPSILAIQCAVADHYGIDAARMREPAPRGIRHVNTWDICRPRQAAMALAVLLTDKHLTTIGRHFGGRDHSTVCHAHKAVARRRRKDPSLHRAMRKITLELVR